MKRTLIRATALAVSACCLAGCAGSSSPSATGTSPAPRNTEAASVVTSKNVCGAFGEFYSFLASHPPRDNWQRIVSSAQSVQAIAIRRAKHGGSRKLFNDANDLVAYVGSPSFPQDGNIMGGPVRRMSNDCP